MNMNNNPDPDMQQKSPKPLLVYMPTRAELPLFESLYLISEVTNKGAREILSLSCLRNEMISIILDMTQSRNKGRLNRAQFYVAVRLIQLHQNHIPVTNLNLTVPHDIDMNPPYFYGISEIESGFYEENLFQSTKKFSCKSFRSVSHDDKTLSSTRSNQSLNYYVVRHEIEKLQEELRRTLSKLRSAIQVNQTLRKLTACKRKLSSITFISNKTLSVPKCKEFNAAI